MDLDAINKWKESLEQFHPHTGFDQYKCDKCDAILTYSLDYVPDISAYNDEWRKTLSEHYLGRCQHIVPIDET